MHYLFYNEETEPQRKSKLVKVTLLFSSDTKICPQINLTLESLLFY